MSGHEYELPGGALSPTEQAKGRRTLVGISTLYLGLALWGFAGVRPLRWLGAVMAMIGGLLALSRPQGAGRALTPRNIRRIARIAAVPEMGAIVVVHGCLIVGITGAIAILTTMI